MCFIPSFLSIFPVCRRGATGSRQAAHGSVSGVDSRWGGNPRHSYLGGVLVGNGPRRGYWRVRVVPGGETRGSPRRGDRGVCGFQPPRLWEWFVGIVLGVFPRVSVG